MTDTKFCLIWSSKWNRARPFPSPTDSDFTGEQSYVLADGSRVKTKTFRIRSLKVGDKVVENVLGSVAGIDGSL